MRQCHHALINYASQTLLVTVLSEYNAVIGSEDFQIAGQPQEKVLGKDEALCLCSERNPCFVLEILLSIVIFCILSSFLQCNLVDANY